MIKYVTLVMAVFAIYTATAQVYPFKESFEGYPAGTIVPGWTGDITVRSNHGIDDSKAITCDLRSTNLVDSITTPLIGPLTSTSNLIFFYRAIDWANWQSTPTIFEEGDSILVRMSTDGGNSFQQVHQIDQLNFQSGFVWRKVRVYVTNNVGANAHFQLVAKFGSGARYYLDFDSLTVANGLASGVEDVEDQVQVSLFPNPAASGTNCYIGLTNNLPAVASVLDVTGKVIIQTSFTGSVQLPTANIAKGLYMVQLKLQDRILTRKLFIGQ